MPHIVMNSLNVINNQMNDYFFMVVVVSQLIKLFKNVSIDLSLVLMVKILQNNNHVIVLF